jgi:hypothetical protein
VARNLIEREIARRASEFEETPKGIKLLEEIDYTGKCSQAIGKAVLKNIKDARAQVEKLAQTIGLPLSPPVEPKPEEKQSKAEAEEPKEEVKPEGRVRKHLKKPLCYVSKPHQYPVDASKY